MNDSFILIPSFSSHINQYLINFLSEFSIAIIFGLAVGIPLHFTHPEASVVFKKSYSQWLGILLFFTTILILGPTNGFIYSAVGIGIITLFVLDEQSKRLNLRPWISKRLQEYTVLCSIWAYFLPHHLLWFVPFIFWLSSCQLMWRMKVSSFREDVSLLLWLTQLIIVPGGLLLAIANLEKGGFQLNIYILSLAFASTFGRTGLAIYDKKKPHLALYGSFAQRKDHLIRWFIGLFIHVLGASIILIGFSLFMNLSLQESSMLAVLVGIGTSISNSMTRFYIYLTSMEDNLVRRDQPMPIFELLSPFLMTTWIVYPYFLYLT
jgi:hypothetical protein